MKIIRKITIFNFILLTTLCFSCVDEDSIAYTNHTNTDGKKTSNNSNQKLVKQKQIDTITLTFAGDIMAHDTNYNMPDYDDIYIDLKDLLIADDLTFGNFETPICDEKPLSTYPNFNVHSNYLEAAINGGFEVFALANNHTNDQGVFGIDGSLKSIEQMKKKYSTEKKVYFSGLKKQASEKFKPEIIKKNNFTILFLSITEILNSHDKSKYRLYYSAPTAKDRKLLLEEISKMREENPCDIFVLSLHLAEAEYIRTVSEQKKQWFQNLSSVGVDIICASHPHVMQTWEKYKKENNTSKTKMPYSFFMYSMGNFISAQRIFPNYKNPTNYKEYTGDAVLLQLKFTKIDGQLQDNFSIKPILVTVYKSSKGLVMKKFNHEFIENLKNEQDKNYYKKRLYLMKEYLPIK